MRIAGVAVLVVSPLVFVTACGPKMGPLPPNRPPIKLVVTKDVADVGVSIATDSYAGWSVTVENKRSEPLKVMWDESSFIAHDGVSQGRLLYGESHVPGKTQTPSPVAAGAVLREKALPERLKDFLPKQIEYANGKPAPSPAVAECSARRQRCLNAKQPQATCDKNEHTCLAALPPIGDAPREVTTGVGRLILVLETNKGREQWEAAIAFDGSTPGAKPEPNTPPAEPPAEPAQ